MFGTDGSLLVSCGTGSTWKGPYTGGGPPFYEGFQMQALEDSIITLKEEIGSYRSQLVDTHAGKILRIDPETGDGLPSNPFYDPAYPRAPRSRVWSLGLRSPFRVAIRPNSGSTNPNDALPGTLYAGDVGESGWEELNIITDPAMNFGWPIYEGSEIIDVFNDQLTINLDAPNEFGGIDGCMDHYYFQDLLKQTSLPAPLFFNPCEAGVNIPDELVHVHSPPAIAWENTSPNNLHTRVGIYDEDGNYETVRISDPLSPVAGEEFSGIASVGGVFYTGDAFPEEYRNTYFHADYRGWIKNFVVDEGDQVLEVREFLTDTLFVVNLAMNEHDGCLYYVEFPWYVRRICYVGNNPPIPIAEFDVNYGASPLEVHFTGDESYDPTGEAITFLWNFGDGTTSTEPNPTHVFTSTSGQPQAFEVTLTLTDEQGAEASETLLISLNNTPPQVNITSFEDGDEYSIGAGMDLPLSAEVVDAEHGPDALSYQWQSILVHNTHFHYEPYDTNITSIAKITPVGCGEAEYHYLVRLTVTDAAGLSGFDEAALFPYCGDPFVNMTQLEAEGKEETVRLAWNVADEINIIHYELERSPDGENFYPVENVVAHAGLLRTGAYEYDDIQPFLGENHYRLRVLGTNGYLHYSNIATVFFEPENPVVFAPNPAATFVNLSLSYSVESLEVEVMNLQGQKVFKDRFSGLNENMHTIDITHLDKGVYLYRVIMGGRTYTGKFVKLTY